MHCLQTCNDFLILHVMIGFGGHEKQAQLFAHLAGLFICMFPLPFSDKVARTKAPRDLINCRSPMSTSSIYINIKVISSLNELINQIFKSTDIRVETSEEHVHLLQQSDGVV